MKVAQLIKELVDKPMDADVVISNPTSIGDWEFHSANITYANDNNEVIIVGKRNNIPRSYGSTGKFVNTTDYSKMSYDSVQRSLMMDNID